MTLCLLISLASRSLVPGMARIFVYQKSPEFSAPNEKSFG